MKALLAGFAFLTIFVGSVVFAETRPPDATFPQSPELNDPDAWGDNCYKIDESGSTTWVADADYELVVLKAGRTNYVWYDVKVGEVLEVPQDISHYVFCGISVPPSTTTTTTSTTTTTEVTTSTTTVPETSIPESSTSSSSSTTTIPVTTTLVSLPQTTTTTSVVTTSPPTVPQPTTTVTASTTTVPTVQPSSTIAPTTTVNPTDVELPKTGTNTNLALVACIMVILGACAVRLARRPN